MRLFMVIFISLAPSGLRRGGGNASSFDAVDDVHHVDETVLRAGVPSLPSLWLREVGRARAPLAVGELGVHFVPRIRLALQPHDRG